MLKSKRGGCVNYADVSNNYMLYDKAITPTTGGSKSRRGGAWMDDMSNILKSSTAAISSTVNTPVKTEGGSRRRAGCETCKKTKKGGAVELAPFAAALAFLATRFATDKNFNMNKMMGSTTKSRKTTKAKSKSRS